MEGGECWLLGPHGACLDIDGTRTVRMSQERSDSAKWTITSARGGGDQHYLMASNKCFLAVTSKGEQSFCLSPITEKFAVWTLKPTSGLEGECFLASFHGTFLASLNDAEQTLYMSPNAEDWEKWRRVPCEPPAPAAQLTVALEAGGGAQPDARALVDAACRHDLSALRGLFAVAATAGCVLETSGPVDADGNTLLHKCSMSSMQGSSTDTEQVLELLAGHGAAINAPNVLGETPLLAALRATAVQSVVRKLLNMRADPNHGDNLTGDTALMEAACGGDAAMCQLLLEAKADPSRQNFQGLTALDLAEAAGQDNLVVLPGLSAAAPDSPDLEDAEEPEQQDDNTAEAHAELQQHCQLRGVPLEALGEHGAGEVLRELARLETLRMDELRRECQSWNLQAEHCYQRRDLVARLQQFFTWQAMPLATLTGEAQTRASQLLRKPGEKDAPLTREELLEALVVASWGGATKGQKLSDGRARGIPVDSLESPEQAAKLMEQLERLEKGSVSSLRQEYLKRGFATRSGAGKEELMVCLKDALVWEVLPVTHLRQVCRRRNLKVGRGEQSREELMELLANATWEDRGIPRQRLPSLVVAQGVLSSVEGFESKSVADVEAFCRKKGLPVEHRPDHQVLVGRVRDMLVWENLPAGELVKECQRRGVSTAAAAEGSQDHSGRGPASPGFRHHSLSMPSPFLQTRFSWKGEEERLLGRWCYGSKSTEYSISRADDGHLRFCGPHAKSGLVSGALQLLGHWWQGLLVSVDGKSVGSIRLRHTMEDDTVTSQFKSAGKEEWGKDVVAKKVEDPAHLAALRLTGRWTYGTKQTEYCVDLDGDVRLRFTGPHSRTGTVSGVLEPRGEWFQAELTAQSGEMVGSIRLRSLEEGSRSISNFRSANMEEWGKDIVANKVGGGVGTTGEKARTAGLPPEGLADHRTLVQRLVQAAHKSMKETRGVQPERFATEEEAEEVFNHILELEQMSDSALRHEHERLNLPVIGNMTWQQVFEAVRLWYIWGKLSLEELEKECAAAARSGDLPSTPSSHTAARVEPVPIKRVPTGPRGGRGLAGKGRALGVMPSNLSAVVSCFKGGHGRGFQPLRVGARAPIAAQVLPSSTPERSQPSASQPGPASTQGAPTFPQQSNTAEPSEERRLDPHDGVMRTLRQMQEWYRGEFSEDDVLKYWDSTCKEATKGHGGLGDEGRRALLKERLLDAFCVRVYESKGIPARRLSNVTAARRVQERFVRLERMNVEDLWKEVTKIFTPSPKESDKLVLLRRLKQSTVWQELPLEELRQEARKVGLQMSSMASSQEIIQSLVRKSWHQERARQPAAPKPQPRPQPKKAVPPKPKLPLDLSKMTRDFERLGLPRTANAAEIRKAYRKLALKYHPDKNPGEAQEAAAMKFREVTAAYEALCGYMRKMEVQ